VLGVAELLNVAFARQGLVKATFSRYLGLVWRHDHCFGALALICGRQRPETAIMAPVEIDLAAIRTHNGCGGSGQFGVFTMLCARHSGRVLVSSVCGTCSGFGGDFLMVRAMAPSWSAVRTPF
jgi:hypothetical protein